MNQYKKFLILGIIFGFIFMNSLAWCNDVLVTMLIGTNWDYALEPISITLFNGFVLIDSIPRVALYVEVNVFVWKNLMPLLCGLIFYISQKFLLEKNKNSGIKNKKILKLSNIALNTIIFSLILLGCSWCWFSIEDWWGFLLRNLFPTVDPLHTLDPLFPYKDLGHPYEINIYGKWISSWKYIGSQVIIGSIILLIAYAIWKYKVRFESIF